MDVSDRTADLPAPPRGWRIRGSATARHIALAGAALLAWHAVAAEEGSDAPPPGLKADPAAMDPAAMEAWQDMRFGMFIHWGPVSLTGREIGWSRGAQTPVEEYDNLYRQFDPQAFDADAWARTAKDAGMKYVVITSKHHDGFCLWPSEWTDYDIGETPFQRDVLAELAAACRKHGLRFGTYYSVCDWWHPDFPLGSPGGRTKKPNPNLERYLEYLRGQVTELIRDYGPLSTMWFDVPQVITRDQAEKTIAMVRGLQPDITINSRAGGGLPGDYDTPEQKIGGFNRERPWETCMTICRQWAWKPNDTMKSLEQCIRTLVHTAGGDGNLLLNVGPMPDGRIEPRQVERLKEMGMWLDRYGTCIYGTRGGPFKPGPWGASTCRDDTVYLFVMRWPGEGGLLLPPIEQPVKACRILSGGEAEWEQTRDGIRIAVPEEDRQEIVTVIALSVDGRAFDLEPAAVEYRSDSLAYGKEARASNVYQSQDAYRPGMAFDDDPETRWATDAGTHSAWLEVDLGRPTDIARVLIDEGDWNRVRRFRLQYGVEDRWETILEGTNLGHAFSATFDRVRARHVRLELPEATEGPTLREFQLFGPDQARAREIADLEFGMFVCWSFSTFSGHEWTPTLDKDASYFRATGCDTDQWCEAARAAGMKYILFLPKHHDGFCLWDTDTTEKKVTNSPLGIDVLAKLRDSCDRYGLKLALYFSEGDWNWPGAVDGKGWRAGAGINADMKKAQLKELLTRYGDIEFWWMDHAVGDGGLSHKDTVEWVHSFQPDSFVGFNHGEPAGRLCLRERGRPGKLGDPDATLYNKDGEASYPGYLAAEFTYPILPEHSGGADWFYSLPEHDDLCHPAEKIYGDYVGAVKHGNIFSVNVGPGYDGRLRDIDVRTLKQVGDMIREGNASRRP